MIRHASRGRLRAAHGDRGEVVRSGRLETAGLRCGGLLLLLLGSHHGALRKGRGSHAARRRGWRHGGKSNKTIQVGSLGARHRLRSRELSARGRADSGSWRGDSKLVRGGRRRCGSRGLEVVKFVVIGSAGSRRRVEDIQAVAATRRFLPSSRGACGDGFFLAKVEKIRFGCLRRLRLGLAPRARRASASPRGACIGFVIFIVLVEPVVAPAGILEVAGSPSEAATVTENASAVSSKRHAIATKASVAATRHTPAHVRPSFEATKLVTVGPGLLALCADHVDIPKELDQFGRPVAHVDSLILPVLIDVVELTQHSKERHMGSGVVNHAFGSVLHEEFQKLEAL